ncbi:MAG: histidinol dehydrogenase [Chloroflexota bacterium]
MIRCEGFQAAADALRRDSRSGLLSGVYGGDPEVAKIVEEVVQKVRAGGDRQLLEYGRVFDGVDLDSLRVQPHEVRAAYDGVGQEFVDAVNLAMVRVKRFHEAFAPRTGATYVEAGLGRQVVPLARVGLYVPGGTAAYPSTVVMTAVPARVAGVNEIVVTSPPARDGRIPAPTLVACDVVGVDAIFKVGGAQGIAALAFGTESIGAVDKICGPGNVYVTVAKKMLYGLVALDGVAGPSEVLVLADENSNAARCAADLLAQAEHDPLASVVLVSTSKGLADEVEREVDRQAALLSRREIVRKALEKGVMAVVDSLDQAVELANMFAPEHLSLAVDNADEVVPRIRNAGCIFFGGQVPVALGDYMAGPSHVLPTGGSARFSSPLGVEDFLKVTSIVGLDRSVTREVSRAAVTIANSEGLDGHARALEIMLGEQR